MENLKVGNRVEVVDRKKQFDKYSLQATRMGARHWKVGVKVGNGEQGIITGLEKHFDYPDGYPLIALVRLENKDVEVLIGVNGLKKIEEEFKVGEVVKFVRHQKDGVKWEETYGVKIGDEGIVEVLSGKTIGVKYHCHNTRVYGYPYQFQKIPNTTPKYDESTTKAIKDSITHHEDNLNRLKTLKGEFYNSGYQCFTIEGRSISYSASACALCNTFSDGNRGICPKCPLTLIGQNCNKLYDYISWKKLRNAKTKEEAITAEENMIKVLKSLVEGYKTEERHYDVLDCKAKKEVKVDNFKAGDRIQTLRSSDYKIGDEGVIEEQSSVKDVFWVRFDNGRYTTVENINMVKIKNMDKYDELEARIRKIICWDKNVEDILYEIERKTVENRSIEIPIATVGNISIRGAGGLILESFTFRTQCEKLCAFKRAIVWLLDHSNIKKKVVDTKYRKCVCVDVAGGLNYTRKGVPIEDCGACNGTGRVIDDNKKSNKDWKYYERKGYMSKGISLVPDDNVGEDEYLTNFNCINCLTTLEIVIKKGIEIDKIISLVSCKNCGCNPSK